MKIRNKVQLIGNLGNDPKITKLENGNSLAKFSVATNESYLNKAGERIENTQWHNIIAWGKTAEIVEKISKGKISKFLNDNSLLNQIWIMDPKKKVSDILKENSADNEIKVLDFVKYKVGEGV